jgi:hypothetical protein
MLFWPLVIYLFIYPDGQYVMSSIIVFLQINYHHRGQSTLSHFIIFTLINYFSKDWNADYFLKYSEFIHTGYNLKDKLLW